LRREPIASGTLIGRSQLTGAPGPFKCVVVARRSLGRWRAARGSFVLVRLIGIRYAGDADSMTYLSLLKAHSNGIVIAGMGSLACRHLLLGIEPATGQKN